MSCPAHNSIGRRFVRKCFDNWKTKLLLTVGVESIGTTISPDWSAFRTSQDINNFEPVPSDFDADGEHCPFCIVGSPDFKIGMSLRDDSGVSSNSTTPAASPRVDLLSSFCAPEQMNSDLVHQMMVQQAFQMQMMMNMQLNSPPQLHPFHQIPQLAPVAPHLPFSAEMQKMILDGQIPYPNPAILAQQQYAWHQMMMTHMQRIQMMHRELPMDRQMPNGRRNDEKPLDLSKKPAGVMGVEGGSKKNPGTEEASTPYDSDEAMSEVKFRPPKRNYSQMDLDAAVNDIRNGKLGTRRASVVYGIPRSTLRNKIYKLEAADEQTGIPFKRRKGTGAVDKTKIETEEQKITPESLSDESSNNSNDQPVAPLEQSDSPPKLASIQETIDAVRLNSANGWPASIWATLFSSSANVSPERQQPKKEKKEDMDWKKSRPKRGQYRKYDKNALDEAVQSVRRGEMSVHRAGSFYGVPHSTLEYKVKERNLMRKKKAEEPEKSIEVPSPTAVDLALRNLQEVLSN